MTNEEKLIAFRAIYEAELGAFPGNDSEQATRWFRFISGIPEESYEALMIAVSESWGSRQGKPRLREFRLVWKRMQFQTSPDRPQEATCAACYGHGVVVLPVHDVRQDGKHLRYVFGSDDVGVLTEIACPCRCSRGREKQMVLGLSDNLCNEAWGFYRDLMISSGHRQIEAPISKAEFYRTQPEKRCTSPRGLMWRLMQESRKVQEKATPEPEKEPEPVVPEPTPTPTPEPEPTPEPWQDRELELVGAQDTSFAFGESVGAADVVEQVFADLDDDLPF